MKSIKIIRYFIVLLLAAALVLGALFVPRFWEPERKEPPATEESATEESRIAENETRVTLTEPSAETTAFMTDPPETEDPEAIRDGIDEEFIPAEEGTDDYTGLRAFFVHKLVTDPEKVELYLNIRETPSMSGKILYVIYPDDIVTYTGMQGDWYRVTLDGVSKEYALSSGLNKVRIMRAFDRIGVAFAFTAASARVTVAELVVDHYGE